ncbi:hypothetical protein AAY473_007863 [Plecturocebus cupreus]
MPLHSSLGDTVRLRVRKENGIPNPRRCDLPSKRRQSRLRQTDHLSTEVRDQPGQRGETQSLLKMEKIILAWWPMPLFPATWEAHDCPCQAALTNEISDQDYWVESLALLRRLEYSGTISAHCNLRLPVDMGFCHVGHAGLELLMSSDPPALASQIAPFYLLLLLRRGLTLSLRLEYSGTVTAICSLNFPGSNYVVWGQAPWLIPVIPGLWEAEVGRSPEAPRRGASQCGIYGMGSPLSQTRLVPSPQGEQQLEALRTESFTASTAEPGKVQLCGEGASAKGKLRNRKNFITGRREIQDGRLAAAQNCSS